MVDDTTTTAPQRGTGLAFVRHWDWVADKGLMPRNTALSIRTSVQKILSIDDAWEEADVTHLDIDALIARFRNLSRLAPNSLATYESRFRSGLASYLDYLDSPASYQPKGRKKAVRDEVARVKPAGRRREGPADHAEPPQPTQQVSSTRLVVYPFPVRPEVFAELKLPADLTTDEANRLAAFLKAVALSDTDSGPAPRRVD